MTHEKRAPSPARGTLFYTTCLFLLMIMSALLPGSLGLGRYAILQVFVFLGVSLFLAVGDPPRSLAEVFRLRWLSWQGLAKSLMLGVMASGLALAVGAVISVLVTRAGGKLPPAYPGLAESSFGMAILVLGFLPAVCEEAAFRGYLLWNLGPLGRRASVVLTAVLFGSIHLTLLKLVPLVVLGLIFTEAVYRTGSILPGVVMHFTNNLVALSVFFWRGPAASSSMPAELSWSSMVIPVAATISLGLAVWGVLRTFGTADLREPGRHTGSETVATTRSPLVFALPLVPAALIYAWNVAMELFRTFSQ